MPNYHYTLILDLCPIQPRSSSMRFECGCNVPFCCSYRKAAALLQHDALIYTCVRMVRRCWSAARFTCGFLMKVLFFSFSDLEFRVRKSDPAAYITPLVVWFCLLAPVCSPFLVFCVVLTQLSVPKICSWISLECELTKHQKSSRERQKNFYNSEGDFLMTHGTKLAPQLHDIVV
jgi:hypothetical protein